MPKQRANELMKMKEDIIFLALRLVTSGVQLLNVRNIALQSRK